ncbi:hypothetical protein [Xanthomonas pisi]|uniref:Uncharacterized protein n=1 Tax=Xanthomonas pisi TaxID=56457 RepID=A0A2S7D592_9XANT|nr:hypothetical protein [Xanthomonas pisi]KLD69153.1 hypothetical protein Y887_18175 [Xanthomonas pisi DSM 18956]PPU68986.1 hypothetical protein XpiCFBP4643_08465 [Xanthomonas pisi]
METRLSACDFYLVVSMVDLVTWVGSDEGNFSVNGHFQQALQELGIKVDLVGLYMEYFDRAKIGTGDVYLYQKEESHAVFAIDLYKELTDQLDIIQMAILCDSGIAAKVRGKLREFFDDASCKIIYEEAHFSSRARDLIDFEKYPLLMAESGYRKNILKNYVPS